MIPYYAISFLLILPLAFGIPLLLIYFIYRLIEGLMKYHHDLKQQDTEKHQREPWEL